MIEELNKKELVEINGGDGGDAAYWIGYGLGKVIKYSTPFGTIYDYIR